MIVSASRRTDVPAFYLEWFLRRLAEGRVRVANPFRPSQQRVVSLAPDDVDAIVFWTRDPAALVRATDRLEELGHRRTVALVTITGLAGTGRGRVLEPHVVPTDRAVEGFLRLAERWGDARRVAWRYDPVILGPRDTPEEHLERFAGLAGRLAGATDRAVVSFLDLYRKTERRLALVGYPVEMPEPGAPVLRELVAGLAAIAREHGMSLELCAEPPVYEGTGARRGRCIDPDRLAALWPDRPFPRKKDPGQRPDCGCCPAVDVGMPDTCIGGCAYCYAVRSHELARRNRARHDPAAESMLPLPPRDVP